MAKKKTITLPVEKISNVSMASSPATAKVEAAREKKWQAEDDLRTLQRAAEVKGDRLKQAKLLAKEQAKALKKIC